MLIEKQAHLEVKQPRMSQVFLSIMRCLEEQQELQAPRQEVFIVAPTPDANYMHREYIMIWYLKV